METYENFRVSREKTLLNSWQILKLAVFLFEKNIYTFSCFLAMTSIEEMGKITALMQLDTMIDKLVDAIPPRNRDQFFRNHQKKAINATGAYLYVNHEADKRHGNDPTSKIHRTAGVFLLGLSNQWMNIRNKCIYTDINFAKKTASNPRDSISREHAYYFICMGFEVLYYISIVQFNSNFLISDDSSKFLHEFIAELLSLEDELDQDNISNSSKNWKTPTDFDMIPEELMQPFANLYKKIANVGIDNLIDQKAIKFRDDRLSDLERFMEKWSNTVDLSKLDFLNNPDPLLKIVKDNEGTENLSECVSKYVTPFKVSNNKKMSKDEFIDLLIKGLE